MSNDHELAAGTRVAIRETVRLRPEPKDGPLTIASVPPETKGRVITPPDGDGWLKVRSSLPDTSVFPSGLGGSVREFHRDDLTALDDTSRRKTLLARECSNELDLSPRGQKTTHDD